MSPGAVAAVLYSRCRACDPTFLVESEEAPGSSCCFIVTVTGVTHPGFAYNPSANLDTTGYANCNTFAPNPCPGG